MPVVKTTGHLTEVHFEQAAAGSGPTDQQLECVYGITPPGIEVEQFQLEECLDDTGAADIEHGSELPNEITGTWVYDPLAANTTLPIVETLVKANTEHHIEIRFTSINRKVSFLGKFRSILPQEATKREAMKADFVIDRTGDYAYADIT